MKSWVAFVFMAFSSVAVAQPSQKLDLTLVAPSSDLPDYVCVVSNQEDVKKLGGPQTSLQGIAPLLNEVRPGVFQIKVGSSQSHSARDGSVELQALSKLESDCVNRDCSCDRMHRGCTPTIALSDAWREKKDLLGYIRCQRSSAPNGKDLVLVLALEFRATVKAPVLDIQFSGNLATIALAREFKDADLPYAFVLGGHYVPEPNAGAPTKRRTIVLPIAMRCPLFTGRLPAHASASLVLAEIGADKTTCVPRSADGQQVELRIPQTGTAAGSVRVHASDAQTKQRSVFEAGWLTTPSGRVLEFGYRSALLRWNKHCLFAETFRPGAKNVQFGGRCPRATMVENGNECTLFTDDNEVCTYSCSAPNTTPPLRLPMEIRFQRISHARDIEDDPSAVAPKTDNPDKLKNPKIGWRKVITDEWSDSLSYSGQSLDSFVPAEERKVEIQFKAHEWKPLLGDAIDAIHVEGPGGAKRVIRLPTDEERHSISSPGLSCEDSISISVQGVRLYYTEIRSIRRGAVALDAPVTFLRKQRAGWHVGIGWDMPDLGETSSGTAPNPRVEPLLDAGFYVWKPVGRETALEFELGLQLARKATSVEPPVSPGALPNYGHSAFHRETLTTTLMASRNRNFRAGIGVGAGVGSPVLLEDSAVAKSEWFVLAPSALVRLRIERKTSMWIEGAFGLRFGERTLTGEHTAGFFHLRLRFGP